ncbi:AMP-binding protein [Photorhabdus luminescens]|uniref:AMP-dependent synthetase n=2 Tax=Photorhabdus luminescens TaxID=29488 RepID=A0A5C4RD02_PHOLU|nr:AMP-binding protein [Photorhabdus luminescens]TDB51632.1 AMP-dependent synthetase [Photorhabdus luminescens subsp. mexicana]TNH41601.1 AMP-dependent synthetase [Photorhabdus luminescens subsp. sonorensis]
MICSNSFLSEYDGVALSPISFLRRAVLSNGDDIAVIDGEYCWTWSQYASRCERLAIALKKIGVCKETVVSALLPNIHELLELHFAVPMAGGILNALSTRTDSNTLNFIFKKLNPKVLFIDRTFISLLDDVSLDKQVKIIVVDVDGVVISESIFDREFIQYESLITTHKLGELSFSLRDEQQAISINVTSGTSGQPKLIVYSHRGVFLNAVSNVLDWDIPKQPIFLWTLPMFHCNGWCFPWAITARGGTHICMRKFDAEEAVLLMQKHKVTHYCGAPIVHCALGTIARKQGLHFEEKIHGLVAGAPPTEMMFSLLDSIGIAVTQVYGMTETYGPVVVCEEKSDWEKLPKSVRISKRMRQGIVSNLQGQVCVLEENTELRVPFDGKTVGELVVRGNMVASYDPDRYVTLDTGSKWLFTGDLAVVEDDGYIRIIDRKKDIIISGGENISSLELENVLSNYPGVLAAAVVAKPDSHWGEVPYAFIELEETSSVTEYELNNYICTVIARYKRPKGYTFLTLPRNASGKIIKEQLRQLIRNS